jgi:hypothetical protein
VAEFAVGAGLAVVVVLGLDRPRILWGFVAVQG